MPAAVLNTAIAMRPGDVVVSRRHKGPIRLVVVYSNGGGIGKKLKNDGTPSRQEVCLQPDNVTSVRCSLLAGARKHPQNPASER